MTNRIESIDMFRGFIILLMALDHTRDFFSGSGLNPRDVNLPILFLTRWVTHLCAPSFIFLAGVSIYLWQQHGRTKNETSRFILTRGLLLIFLEFTLVRFGWTFNLNYDFMIAQVIWAIGVSMVFMSITIYLPLRLLALLSGIVILGHNVLDSISAEIFGDYKWVWMLLHQQATITPLNGVRLFVSYPFIPWLGVMSLGYCFGRYFLQSQASRVCNFLLFGSTSLALFAALRFSNYYGDPMPWVNHGTTLAKILSFINCEKYPPSLLYLLMTLGLASLLLAFMEKVKGKLSKYLLVFGRVPLLFYIIHIPVIHLVALSVAAFRGENMEWLFKEPFFSKPADYGYNLGIIYLVWIVVIACLYPVCRQYGQLKQKHGALLRYL